MADRDYDAVVIGAGHNGLVCAAYLARAGRRTLLVEARSIVGGTAASEPFAGATVNLCNCDHITFRTTPVMDELDLADHGLRYIDVEPAQLNAAWSGGAAWPQFHSVERTLDALGATHPHEVNGYRRYAAAAMPAVRLILDAAAEPPRARTLARVLAARRGRGSSTLLRWSRRSAADVARHHFRSDALQGPLLATGPMVWGISPEQPGSGLGALAYALRHVGRLGRPVGGSGMVPESLRRAFVAHGGEVRTSTPVGAITCEGGRVRGVALDDGTEITADVVVSACDPRRTFLSWLRNPPPQARDLVRRWQSIPQADGYESKIDAVMTEVPRLTALDDALTARLGVEHGAATTVIAPSIAEIHRGAEMMARGQILDRPALLVNVPTVLDPSMGPTGRHVLSLEALYTPYGLQGGWPQSPEPGRWLDRFAEVCQPGWRESVGEWRVMTPDRYERDLHLPRGHANSFAGGPLAALRNRNPELTRYETPVQGLYLTGAATFPGAGVWGASGRNAALTILR